MNYTKNLADLQEYVTAYDAYTARRERVAEFGGQMIRLYRDILKTSVRKLAAALDVTPSYLSKIERGLEPLSPDLARKILEMHGTLPGTPQSEAAKEKIRAAQQARRERERKEKIARQWERGEISTGQAARLLDISIAAFLDILAEFKISYIQYTVEEALEEAGLDQQAQRGERGEWRRLKSR